MPVFYSHVYPVSGEIMDREKTGKWGLDLGISFSACEGEDEKWDSKGLCTVKAVQGPESLSPSSGALLEGRMVPRPEPRLGSLALAKLGSSRGRRDAASGRQAASWGRGVALTPPAGRRVAFSGFFLFLLFFPLFISHP